MIFVPILKGKKKEKTLRTFKMVLDISAVFHTPLLETFQDKLRKEKAKNASIPNRIQQQKLKRLKRSDTKGDETLKKIKDLFHYGMQTRWGPEQVDVFNIFVESCLPLIYGDSWEEERPRVLAEHLLNDVNMFTLISMPRRHGKTYVTSGTAAALFLMVPGIKIAIFSTCKRTSQMMMQEIEDKIEKAFNAGTHVKRSDYNVISKNTECIVMEHQDGTKRSISSYPGSVKVSVLISL
jgi:hypothetical protein